MEFHLPRYPFIITFGFLAVVMIARYFLLVGGIKFFSERSATPLIDQTQTTPEKIRQDKKYSVISSIIFAFFGALLIYLWQENLTKIYSAPDAYGWPYFVLSGPLFLFIHDTYFYWTHRWLHLYKFRECHLVHHRSTVPTGWTSFSFHPVEAFIQALILPVLAIVLPIHFLVLGAVLIIMSVCGVLNHLGRDHYPAAFKKKFYLISATHHQAHHRNLGVNFGLYFTFWDHLMGTEYE